MEKINILYKNNNMDKLKKIEKGDWIDLRCNGAIKITSKSIIEDGNDIIPILKRTLTQEDIIIERGLFDGEEVDFIRYRKGDFMLINLGIAMELPNLHEAYVVPRGSTFKNFGLIQTNSPGVVDYLYRGDDDVWFMPVLAQRDGFIIIGERVCQFRIQDMMPEIEFNEVSNLGNENRNAHGSTGTR